jgi:hypothetical protein
MIWKGPRVEGFVKIRKEFDFEMYLYTPLVVR